MKNSILFAAIVLGFISCENDPPEPDTLKTYDKGAYAILIDNTTTGVITQLIDTNADTNWDPTTGAIFMNTDDSLSCGDGVCPCLLGPIGTMTMTVSGINKNTSSAILNAILVSKSDVVCGTAAQLNAQLFLSFGPEDLFDLEIGANYIGGRIDKMRMELQTLNEDQTPETAIVSVVFVAIDR